MDENKFSSKQSLKPVGMVRLAKRRFSLATFMKKDGSWRVLGITVETWVFAFLIALAIPYINIVAIPVMFFVFAGALAVYSVMALLNMD
jgi:hypothetical protein